MNEGIRKEGPLSAPIVIFLALVKSYIDVIPNWKIISFYFHLVPMISRPKVPVTPTPPIIPNPPTTV